MILLIFFFIGIVGLGLMIWAVVDIAKSEFPGNGKLIWLLVVLLAGLIGIIIYFAVGRSQKIPKDQMGGQPGRNPFGE
jgi:FtsH-binding integral membrane protein